MTVEVSGKRRVFREGVFPLRGLATWPEVKEREYRVYLRYEIVMVAGLNFLRVDDRIHGRSLAVEFDLRDLLL